MKASTVRFQSLFCARFLFFLLFSAAGSYALAVGDRVSATANLNVRPSPGSSTVLGTQSAGSQGVLIAGPQTASLSGASYVWWQVAWDSGSSGWSADTFLMKVTVPAPTITSISPNPVTGSNADQQITINGTGFVNKPAVSLTWTGGSTTLGTGQVAFLSSTQLQMTITTQINADTWTVRVTNPDGRISNTASFNVVPPAVKPIVSSISPSSPSIGRQSLQVFGGNFQTNLTVDFYDADGMRIGVLSGSEQIQVLASNSFTMVVDLGNEAGNFGFEVINPDGQRSSKFSFRTQLTASGLMSVTPNPCSIIAPAGSCAVVLSWSTKSVRSAQIWMEDSQRPEQRLFDGLSGSQTVSGLLALPQYYTFRLYDYSSGNRDRLITSLVLKNPQPSGSSQDVAELLSDSPQEGSTLNPSSSFIKNWIIRNLGTTTWNAAYQLRLVSGSAGTNRLPLTGCASVPPGAFCRYSTTVQVPQPSGNYREDWSLFSSTGKVVSIGSSTTVSLSYRVSNGETSDDARIISQPNASEQLFTPGQILTQTFRIENTGLTLWDSVTLVWLPAASTNNQSERVRDTLAVANTATNQVASVTIPMLAPMRPGIYRSSWQLQNRSGIRFGPILSTKVEVIDDSTLFLGTTETFDRVSNKVSLSATVRDVLVKPISRAIFTWTPEVVNISETAKAFN